MSKVSAAQDIAFTSSVPVLIIGAGACGLTAALKAKDAGSDVVVLERDPVPSGSTAMSSGFIPAAQTRCQLAAHLAVPDSQEAFANDIRVKSKYTSDNRLIDLAVSAITPTMDWLEESHGFEWMLLDDFLYPGHSRYRMHALPEKTGASLIARLCNAAESAGVQIVTAAHVTELFADGNTVRGLTISRPDGSSERIGCKTLILACNGYGGNRELIRKHIPLMGEAPYYGHPGNMGDAVLWGQALGAEVKHLSGCQGHGSLAHPYGILITWALMVEGGFQVNSNGERFSNEHQGYSEQSIPVLAQPGGIAWCVFDQRLHDFAQSFPDFVEAGKAGAIKSAATIEALAGEMHVSKDTLKRTFDRVTSCQKGHSSDPFGRDFTTKPQLAAPYFAVKVTGALFHTQGGLMINEDARVMRTDGTLLSNLFAGGGAACGVSGPEIYGYLSGNGLLTAVAFGALAGAAAARHQAISCANL